MVLLGLTLVGWCGMYLVFVGFLACGVLVVELWVVAFGFCVVGWFAAGALALCFGCFGWFDYDRGSWIFALWVCGQCTVVVVSFAGFSVCLLWCAF